METRGSTLRDFGDTKTFACAAIAGARFDGTPRGCYDRSAGWSSLVARWAHNPKVGGSNPPPATKSFIELRASDVFTAGAKKGNKPASAAKCDKTTALAALFILPSSPLA